MQKIKHFHQVVFQCSEIAMVHVVELGNFPTIISALSNERDCYTVPSKISDAQLCYGGEI